MVERNSCDLPLKTITFFKRQIHWTVSIQERSGVTQDDGVSDQALSVSAAITKDVPVVWLQDNNTEQIVHAVTADVSSVMTEGTVHHFTALVL